MRFRPKPLSLQGYAGNSMAFRLEKEDLFAFCSLFFSGQTVFLFRKCASRSSKNKQNCAVNFCVQFEKLKGEISK